MASDLLSLTAWALGELKKQGKLSCGFDSELSGNPNVYKHILVELIFCGESTV